LGLRRVFHTEREPAQPIDVDDAAALQTRRRELARQSGEQHHPPARLVDARQGGENGQRSPRRHADQPTPGAAR